MTTAAEHHDVVVVGSGFGGSVSALRLAEKGYAVTVLEAGRRFEDADFARTSWDLRRFLWAPGLGLHGIQRIHLLPDVLVLAGAGVGGGSLNYANTLYRPESDAFYEDPQWAGLTDWRAELAPHYDTASRMLGVVTNPTTTPVDLLYREVAEELGVADTFRPTPVGVFFGRGGELEPGVEVDDPFFGGAGPRRTGCLQCGECMVGCRHGAKNTLVKNYLWLAERAGARVDEPRRWTTGRRGCSTPPSFCLRAPTSAAGWPVRRRRACRCRARPIISSARRSTSPTRRATASRSMPTGRPRAGAMPRARST